MKRLHAAIVMLLMTLTGCAGLPSMPKVAPNQPTAEVQLSPNMEGSINIFYGGKGYVLSAGNTGIASIPVGMEVSFSRYASSSVNMGVVTEIYHCLPGARFYPVAGRKYYVDFELRGNRCALFIFRENQSRIGIEFEPSYIPTG